ncbi:monovalent cation:H+ antiporter, CPA1 (nhx1) [Terramyces sp. JEL0728]|nr:monovalent cation:H+ antiporter, CPA1 (nhx1) [Terramyces sp. JEL0728]
MIVGAIISSTDTVSILSIFHQLQVDPKLFSIIFGESVLNDSVVIVLVSTLEGLRGKQIDGGSIVMALLMFIGIFIGSIVLGIFLGVLFTLVLKYTDVKQFPFIGACLLILQAYVTYLAANSIRLSGIVALLFYGIVARHYAYDHMCKISRETSVNMFRVLSQLAENFIFIYLGVAWFTQEKQVFEAAFVFYTLGIILVARFAAITPLAFIINLYAKIFDPNNPHAKVPFNHQIMMWWAGLRGAIAFVLSLEISGSEKEAVQSTILVICVITVVVFGSSTPFALKLFKIKTGVGSEPDQYNDELSEGLELEAFDTIDPLDPHAIPVDPIPDHWFFKFERKYLKPLFAAKESPE